MAVGPGLNRRRWGQRCGGEDQGQTGFPFKSSGRLRMGFDQASNLIGASQVAQQERIPLQCKRPGFDPWVRKIPWRREWQSLQCSCLESHGQR